MQIPSFVYAVIPNLQRLVWRLSEFAFLCVCFGRRTFYFWRKSNLEIVYSNYESLSAFLNAVAEECLPDIPDSIRSYMRTNPTPSFYHLDVGLYVRNKFIYPQKEISHGKDDEVRELIEHADDHSISVIEIIIKKLSE